MVSTVPEQSTRRPIGVPHNPGDQITARPAQRWPAGRGVQLRRTAAKQYQRPGPCQHRRRLYRWAKRHPAGRRPGRPARLGQASSLATTRTDANGNYTFSGLAPGEYQVFEHQPAGYFDGVDHPGTAGGRSDGVDTILGIVLASGTNAERYNFCEHVGVTLSGHVYHDANNDGQRDTDEPGIGGVTLMLLDADGHDTGIRATTSTADHNRAPTSSPTSPRGRTALPKQQPAGYLDGLDTPGNRGGQADNPGDRIVGAVLAFGQRGEDYNFGELLPSSISGQVHASTDGDCSAGPNDILLADVQVDLLDGRASSLATTRTDAKGNYTFTGLAPGEYQVFEHQPAGYFDGADHPGTAGGRSDGVDTILGIVLTSGTNAERYNFCEHVGVTLSGHVYHDASNDGQRDADEAGHRRRDAHAARRRRP